MSPLQTSAAASSRRVSPLAWPRWLRLSWSWRITWIYLILVLFLPLGAMALKALAVGPVEFFNLATTPEALATYRITFGLSLVAALLNGVFGVVIAWALVRCRFPGQRLLDLPCPPPWRAWPLPAFTAPMAGLAPPCRPCLG